MEGYGNENPGAFQPTRPLRGATADEFYVAALTNISTHAPLAGRDEAPPLSENTDNGISTHAPLAGRDCRLPCRCDQRQEDFNPRAPCGARLQFNINNLYGFRISTHAPVGKYAAFAYTAALNHLLADSDHVQHIGDTTVVCWAEGADDAYPGFFSAVIGGGTYGGLSDNDLRAALKRLANGLPCDDLGVDPNRPFYILGLAPNAARLSVRFFLRDSFGKLMENVNAHYARLEIAGAKYSILPLWALLNATVRDPKKQVPSPVVSGATVRAVFSGTPYPVSLMEAVLLRIRAERNVTWERAAILKAYLAKNYERGSDHSMFSEVTSVQLNEDCNYMPYLLGRLFRVMEEIQLASMGWSVNRSIRDSYFNSAASTPRSVFGKLFSLSNYHLKKLMRDKPGLGKKLGDLESDLAARLTTPPPARFTQEETICFYLGYYHQCNDKKEEKENV